MSIRRRESNERKIDSFNSMTSVFGNRITPLFTHTHTRSLHSTISPLMRMNAPFFYSLTLMPLTPTPCPIDATIYFCFVFCSASTSCRWFVDAKTYSTFIRCQQSQSSSSASSLVRTNYIVRSHFTLAFFFYIDKVSAVGFERIANIHYIFSFSALLPPHRPSTHGTCNEHVRMIDRAKRNLGFYRSKQ